MRLVPRARRFFSTEEVSSCTGDEQAVWGPADPPLEPGVDLAEGYTVVEHLRRGRRLDVYDVWSHERACRCVAKTLRPERASDPVATDRLLLEGRLLAQLTHPHLLRAYGTVGTITRPRPVVLTETLPGHTLGALIELHRRLGPHDVAELGVQLCSVLGYLHRHGWVHLDVKPANIVASGGRAVLLDLSLVCRIGNRSFGGTFDYLSPEQVHGNVMTEATDVWGLGVTLYEALSGATPWSRRSHRERTSDGSLRYPQTEERAEPLRVGRRWSRGRVPAVLAAVVDGSLDPDPNRRPTLGEVSAALAPFTRADSDAGGASHR